MQTPKKGGDRKATSLRFCTMFFPMPTPLKSTLCHYPFSYGRFPKTSLSLRRTWARPLPLYVSGYAEK